MKIYLAGKISQDVWRDSIVDYHLTVDEKMKLIQFRRSFPDSRVNGIKYSWPIREKAILNQFDYVGPFLMSDKEWCYKCTRTDCHECGSWMRITANCTRRALHDADLVFAWINEVDIPGTIAEMSFASAIGCPVYVGVSSECLEEKYEIGKELLFTMEFTKVIKSYYSFESNFMEGLDDCDIGMRNNLFIAKSPIDALKSCLEWIGAYCESPIELMFWEYARNFSGTCSELNGIVPQFKIGEYRTDFAIPSKKVVIELDGHDYHKTKEQRTHDAKRERFLMEKGWQVIRFTGSEIYNDTRSCISQLNRIVSQKT